MTIITKHARQLRNSTIKPYNVQVIGLHKTTLTCTFKQISSDTLLWLGSNNRGQKYSFLCVK